MNVRTQLFAPFVPACLLVAACTAAPATPAAAPTAIVVDSPVPAPTTEPEETAAPEPTVEATAAANLTLSLEGLRNLGPGWAYEGWLIVDGRPITAGVFTVDDEGTASASAFDVAPDALAGATAYVLTIEPSPDPDPAPSTVHILAGDFAGDVAALGTAHPSALGFDFTEASGTYILGIPSSDSDTDSYRSGIWFTELDLPEAPAGWIYEGWVVGPDGPISTGLFSAVDSADSDGAGPTSGPNPGPAFPGQDFLVPPIDLTDGYAAVISIEPEIDNSPDPFALKPLVHEAIEDAGDHVDQTMANEATTFPTGVASR